MSKIGSDTTLAKSAARRAPDAILNSGTSRMVGVRSYYRGHVSKVCNDVLHFLHEEVNISRRASVGKHPQQSEVQPHQLGQEVAKIILSEDTD